MEDDNQGDEGGTESRSAVAQEVARLKEAAFSAMDKRERLPQPLFWSAFGYAVSRLRSAKHRARMLKDVFEG